VIDAQRVREIQALLKAGVRLQQPDALALVEVALRVVELREAVRAIDVHHGTGCGVWRHERCTCGLDALMRIAR
jgi:hypothetical protein